MQQRVNSTRALAGCCRTVGCRPLCSRCWKLRWYVPPEACRRIAEAHAHERAYKWLDAITEGVVMNRVTRRGLVATVLVVGVAPARATCMGSSGEHWVTQPGTHLSRAHIRLCDRTGVALSCSVMVRRALASFLPASIAPTCPLTRSRAHGSLQSSQPRTSASDHYLGVDPSVLLERCLRMFVLDEWSLEARRSPSRRRRTSTTVQIGPSAAGAGYSQRHAARVALLKEEILEFYANQFHVSSNGRGLGIVAHGISLTRMSLRSVPSSVRSWPVW